MERLIHIMNIIMHDRWMNEWMNEWLDEGHQFKTVETNPKLLLFGSTKAIHVVHGAIWV